MSWQLVLEALGGSEAGEVGRIAYHLFSGVIPATTVFAGAVALYTHHQCHERGCWRLGRRVDHEGNRTCMRCYWNALPAEAIDAVQDVREASTSPDRP